MSSRSVSQRARRVLARRDATGAGALSSAGTWTRGTPPRAAGRTFGRPANASLLESLDELGLEGGGVVRDGPDLVGALQELRDRLAAPVERRVVVALLEAVQILFQVEELGAGEEGLVL